MTVVLRRQDSILDKFKARPHPVLIPGSKLKLYGYMVVGILLGLAIAAPVLWMLLQEKHSVEEKLLQCNTGLGEARVRLSMLNASLAECRKSLAEKSKEAAELEKKLDKAVETIQSLNYTLKSFAEKYSELKAKYSLLEKNYTALREQYSRLEKSYRELNKQYNETIKAYNELNKAYVETVNRYTMLKENYTRLAENYTLLLQAYRTLKVNYTRLVEDYDRLKALYGEVSRRSSDLEREYQELQQEYLALQQDYNTLHERYNRLENGVKESLKWLGIHWGREEAAKFYRRLLGEAKEQIQQLISLVGLPSNLGNRGFWAFEKTLYLLSYCSDSYVKYFDPYAFTEKSWDNVIMMPNETWKNGCGDCEDLALFVYSILAATAEKGETFFLVEFYWDDTGHAAVLAVKHTWEGKEYYIIDPAGNYFDGVGIYYRMSVINNYGEEQYYYFSPLILPYSVKREMGTIATKIYYDYFEETESGKPTIYYYRSARSALEQWIIDYWEAHDLQGIVLINEKYYVEFNSVIDAANWIEAHT